MGTRKTPVPTSLGILLWTYRSIPYTWRHAIGEMIDNSIDSYLRHKDELPDGLDVRISYSGVDRTLIIQDNAYGMSLDEINDAVQITRRKWKKNEWTGGIGKR